MKNAKVVIAVVLMVFTAIVAMGYLTFHRSDSRKDVLFDTENVVNDIRIISSGHHSVLHPAGRDSVRAFLCTALSEMGGVPEVLPYDSVPSRFGGTFDIADVFSFLNNRQDLSFRRKGCYQTFYLNCFISK